jgi:hypothetical protein
MWQPEPSSAGLSQEQTRELEALDRALTGMPAAEEVAEHRDLAGLVLAVRDDAPPLRAAFTDELDARVAAGFPRRPAPIGAPAGQRRAARRIDSRHWLAGLGGAASLALVVAVVVVVAGRTGGPANQAHGVLGRAVLPASGTASSAATAPAPRSGGAGAAGPALQNVAPALPAPTPAAGAGAARAVQRDASLALLAPRGQVQQVADRAIAATDRLGGIVESSSVSVDDRGGSQASLELRVPAAVLDRTLAALSALAHVSSRSEDTQDITDATGAARERLAESRAERDALLRQLARASGPNQVASIHARLGLVVGRIGQDQAQLQTLLERGAFAQVGLGVTEDGQATGNGGSSWGPGAALADALIVLEAVFSVLVVALAGLVPAAVLGGLAWWGARPLRRRRREAALSS